MMSVLSVWLRPKRHQIPLKIAGIYAVAGALWIVFSDRALSLLVPPAATEELTHFQTIKGLFFIGCTAALVYWLVKSALIALGRTEEALHESESRYRQFFQSTGSMALLVAADSRVILDANPAAVAFYGWPREELIGKSLAELEALPPDHVAAEDAAGRKYRNLLHRIRSGETRDVEVYSSPLVIDGRQCLYAIIHDVTERRVMERSLADSEARYRQLLTEASDGILLSDPQGRILEVNPAICDMLGWSRGELLGRGIEALLPPEELARKPFRTKELEAGRTLLNERRLLSRSGLLLDTEICSRLVAGGSLLSLVRDVTHRRQLEEQLRQAQKMEAVGRLTGGIAHDLNNLLTVVLVNGELIAEALPPGRADLEGDLDDLRAAAQRGATMIAKLLSFSRRATLSFVTVNLADLVGELLKGVRRILPAEVALDFFHDASGVKVRADPNAIEQILLNLASNAREAMPKGGRLVIETRRLRIEAEPAVERPGGDYGCLVIRDDGAGMDEEVRRQVFEPFFTTKSGSQGSGLGMSIVYGLAQQHGGFVELESTPGVGTTVRVCLPVAATEARRVTPGRGTLLPKGGDERILLVEDEEPLRRVAQRALERLGYTVVPATDGAQALELYRGQEGRIDLVITDLMMPKLGGVALYETLRREGRRTRFLFTSGYSADEMPDQDFPEGGPALLQKPWSLADFTAKVREVLDQGEELG